MMYKCAYKWAWISIDVYLEVTAGSELSASGTAVSYQQKLYIKLP